MQMLTDLFTKRPWLAWFWTLLILVACTWPGKDLPAAPMMGFDKIVHVSLFFVWIILWVLVYPQKSRLLVFAGMAYGLGLEFYQQLLPFDRTFDWWDAAADATGVIAGFLFLMLVSKSYRQRLY